MNFSKHIQVVVLTFFYSLFGWSQITNNTIVAEIKIIKTDAIFSVTGYALNNTEVYKSLSYSLSVIKKNKTTQNSSKNSQKGRFTLEPNQNKKLSTTAINIEEEDSVVILLLVYNEDQQIVGKDRKVLNEDKDAQEKTEQEPNDGLEIKGLVTEDTKTKPGKDFYELFFNRYNFSQIKGNKIINITEKMSFGRKTMIEVKVGDKLINSFFVKSDEDYLASMSAITMRKVYRYFERQKKEKYLIQHY